MYIKYTYKEEDRPIEGASFRSTYDAQMAIELIDNGNEVAVLTNSADGRREGGTFSKDDFADFTALVNRINKQIGNE